MLVLSNVEKTFTNRGMAVRVLRGVNLSVDAGTFTAIMGPSGSGKTTLMNLIGLIERPTGGDYLFEGQKVAELNDSALSHIRNSRIGFVFQMFNLIDRLTVLDNVLMPLLYASPYPKDAKARAISLLQQVGLEHRIKFKPSVLSGGEQQRVAIARALINDPGLILADEPTGNLDSSSGRGIMELLSKLHDRGRTIVLITHDPEVAAYAQRTLLFESGQIMDGRESGS